MSCYQEPKKCLCRTFNNHLDCKSINATVGSVAAVAAAVLMILVCLKTKRRKLEANNVRRSFSVSQSPGIRQHYMHSLIYNPSVGPSKRGSRPRDCGGERRSGQYFDRVIGKWVDDVRMDEDGQLLRVIEADPGGVPNLPYDVNSTDVPMGAQEDIRRPPQWPFAQHQHLHSGLPLMAIRPPPHHDYRGGHHGRFAPYFIPSPIASVYRPAVAAGQFIYATDTDQQHQQVYGQHPYGLHRGGQGGNNQHYAIMGGFGN